jgi:curved DNA-binding protein CbpA
MDTERRGRYGWAIWAVAGVSLLTACPTTRMECCGADVFHRTHWLQRGAGTSVLRLRGGTECYYELLGLQKGETPSENCIRRAYHKMALRCHPDRAPPEKKEQAERAFKALKEAYDVLMNPSQRRVYDGAGFNAQFMPSACAEDMPSAFDSLSEWEKYFGVPFSCDESSDDDKRKDGVGELKALKEALNHAYGMPSACPDDMPSIFDSISVWEKYLGLPVSHATTASSSAGLTDATPSTNAAGEHGAHEQRPVKPDADSSVGFEGMIEVINAESAIERNVYADLLASMNDKEVLSQVEAGAVVSGVISEWEKYLGVSPSCTAMQVL